MMFLLCRCEQSEAISSYTGVASSGRTPFSQRRLLPLRPLHDLPESCFHVVIRSRDRHAEKTLALRAEAGAGYQSYACLIEDAFTGLERGHLQRTHVEEKVERTLWRRHQDILAFEFTRDPQHLLTTESVRCAHVGSRLLDRGIGQGKGSRLLHERRDAGNRVLSGFQRVLDHRLRRSQIAHAPACHRIGLREAVDKDRPFLRSIEGCRAGWFLAII